MQNLKTKEDGKVIEAYLEDGVAMHMVSVSQGSTGWSSGARVAYWSEDDMAFSTTELVK